MRTTVNVDQHVLENARRRARNRGITLGELVEDALRRELASSAGGHERPRIPVFRGGTGMRPGIDPSSNRSMWEALDEALPAEKLR